MITNENGRDNFSLDTFGCVLCDELSHCDEFLFSVAFITPDGVEAIRNALQIAKTRGVKGKILTTDYECFTSPEALDNLAFQFSENIAIKLYRCKENDGFHAKAYIFRRGDYYRVFVGSSNLTRRALDVNKEWNTKVVCSRESDYLKAVLREFDKDWNDSQSQDWKECNDYLELYRYRQKQLKEITKALSLHQGFRFNDMQTEFVQKLKDNVRKGKKKILLVSATGSGKTYAAALGTKAIHAEKVLFVMNREKVLLDSMETFRKVYPEKDKSEFYLWNGGKTFDSHAKFLFATPSMLVTLIRNKEIQPDYFDFVILDEIHHLGLREKTGQAKSVQIVSNQYGEIFHYFTPKYGTLGMTATPIRTDGFDILAEFDNNVACQFTLMDALSANLVCPFFYFGIDDEYLYDDTSSFFRKISRTGKTEEEYQDYISELCSENHVRKILMQSFSHIYSGSRLRSLIFVPTVDIGRKLEERINSSLSEVKREMGFKGFIGKAEFTEDNNGRLIEQIGRFETEEETANSITFLITVNKLSEGVDIPSINQVIFLRPTMSPIVFSQQLGRGLRLGKGYLVVLDFIGNNDRMSYLMPMSLIGNVGNDKFLSATAASHGRIALAGGSVITLTPKAKEEILKAIDKANFYAPSIFKDAYLRAKALVGRLPSMIELEEFGSVDATGIVNTPYRNYYSLVNRCDSKDAHSLSAEEVRIMSYLQWKIGEGKRIQEPLLLFYLITQKEGFSLYLDEMTNIYHHSLTQSEIDFSCRLLTLGFEKDQTIARNYSNCIFLQKKSDGKLALADGFLGALKNNTEFRTFILFLLEYAVKNYRKRFSNPYTFQDGLGNPVTVPFCLNQTYSYQDYYTLLEKKLNKNPQFVGGYDTAIEEDIIPIFVNYNKNQKDRFNYKDYFVDESHFVWYTKEKTRIDSPFMDRVRHYRKNHLKFLLFIRKEKNQNRQFYFLGSVHPTGIYQEETKVGKDGKETPVVRIEMSLDTPVNRDLYHHLTFQDGLTD